MKLILFQCGTIKTKKHLLAVGNGADCEIEVPVPFFLVEHPEGKVLFDTGQPLSSVNSPAKGNYIPVMTGADYVSSQLRKIGLGTTDITHIVLSHLHSDHAGGLEAFENSICYIQSSELQYADNRDIIDKYNLNWCSLAGDHDVFGDGKVRIIFTPGHTPGHQSLLLKLEVSGEFLLASDSVYTEEILQEDVMPGVFHNREETIRTIDKIKQMRRDGVRVITGHDPQAWKRLKSAPAYYE